jgi:hypothetical protein
MSQSSIILGALFGAFLVYITSKGELPVYMSFFGIGGQSGSSGSPLPSNLGSVTPNATLGSFTPSSSAVQSDVSAIQSGMAGAQNNMGYGMGVSNDLGTIY